jgi:hypothetical protein
MENPLGSVVVVGCMWVVCIRRKANGVQEQNKTSRYKFRVRIDHPQDVLRMEGRGFANPVLKSNCKRLRKIESWTANCDEEPR